MFQEIRNLEFYRTISTQEILRDDTYPTLNRGSDTERKYNIRLLGAPGKMDAKSNLFIKISQNCEYL